MAVGEAAVVQQLQQHIEDVIVGFFYFVQKDDCVGAAAHGFGQLAAFVIAHIAGRGADEAAHRMLFHVFAHVYAHHRFFAVKEEIGQRAGQLGLAYACGAYEQERTDGAVRVGETGAAAADGV